LPPTAARRSVFAPLIVAIVAVCAGGLYLYLQHRSASKVKSLIVLPFVNAAANPDAEYLSDGIADGLINSLSQIPELRVIARTTAFRYKGKEPDFEGLRRQLSVDGVLSGRVQQVGNKLVIQADLVDTGTGSQLWGEQYNRPLTDALFIQEEITKSITDKLRPRLAPDLHNRVTRRYTDNSEAYQLYLKGRFFFSRPTKDGFTRSREYFQRAIELDPTYALAYSGLADSYALREYTSEPAEEAYPQARRAALKALALDDQLAEAHVSLGLVGIGTWDWTTAEKEYKRAIELNPNLSRAHNNYGVFLFTMGRIEEALAEYRIAQQLDPANVVPASNIGGVLCQLGQYERGISAVKDALALEPNFLPSYPQLSSCYLRQKMYPRAIAALKEALSRNLSGPRILGGLAYVYAVSGNTGDALGIVEELKAAASTDDDALIRIAQVYIGLDDKERAFEWLEKAYQRRFYRLRDLKQDFVYDPLRSDPRFKDLLRRVGLPP
jgi:TolB-like protein/Tfp pilus assembly protein PilF